MSVAAEGGIVPSLAPHGGCFGDGCDDHLPALFRGHQRGVRSWRPVRSQRRGLCSIAGRPGIGFVLDSGRWVSSPHYEHFMAEWEPVSRAPKSR